MKMRFIVRSRFVLCSLLIHVFLLFIWLVYTDAVVVRDRPPRGPTKEWPSGEYGLPALSMGEYNGCPDYADFSTGDIDFSIPESGPFLSKHSRLKIETLLSDGETELHLCWHSRPTPARWPHGVYCIMQARKQITPVCPTRFTIGTFEVLGFGSVPTCCRNDSSDNSMISLPTDHNFFLLPLQDSECQPVSNMDASEEWIDVGLPTNNISTDGLITMNNLTMRGRLIMLSSDENDRGTNKREGPEFNVTDGLVRTSSNMADKADLMADLRLYARIYFCLYSATVIPIVDEVTTTTGTNKYIIGASVGCSLILLTIILVIYYIVKRRRRNQLSDDEHWRQTTLGKGPLSLSPLLLKMLSEDVQQKMQKLLIANNKIEITSELGHGAFGTVYKARYRPDNNPLNAEIVAIKSLADNCIGSDISKFVDEAVTMATFKHIHVLSIIGVCINPDTQVPVILMPFMENGDLVTYLRKFRYNETDLPSPDVKQLLLFCLHIAKGMSYLTGQKLIHRDLAARNCMLNDKMVVKVADFGLARDVYSDSYYRQDQQKLLPIKWMALECLRDRVFTLHSDIWSFGVAMWEVLSLGNTPYPELDNINILKHLNAGSRLDIPSQCPDQMFTLMSACWDVTPSARPGFNQIAHQITNYLSEMCGYLDLDDNQPDHPDQEIETGNIKREGQMGYQDYREAPNEYANN